MNEITSFEKILKIDNFVYEYLKEKELEEFTINIHRDGEEKYTFRVEAKGHYFFDYIELENKYDTENIGEHLGLTVTRLYNEADKRARKVFESIFNEKVKYAWIANKTDSFCEKVYLYIVTDKGKFRVAIAFENAISFKEMVTTTRKIKLSFNEEDFEKVEEL